MQSPQNLIRRYVAVIVGGTIIIIALLSMTTKLGLDNLNALNESLRTVVQQNNIRAKYIDQMRSAIQSRMLLLHTAIHLNDPFEIEDVWEQYSLLAGQFIKARENLYKMGLTEHQKQQLRDQRKTLAKAQTFLDKVLNAIRAGDKKTAGAFILKAQAKNILVANGLFGMKNLQQAIAEKAVSDSAKAMRQARTSILSLTMVMVVIALILLVIVVLIITRQGKKVASLLQELEDLNIGLEQEVIVRTEELLNSREENARMGAELAVTHQLQQMILPSQTELRELAELTIAAKMSPAEEAGGDYYDVLQYNQQILIGVGDVTGHGLESSAIMLMVQTAVRTLAVSGETNPEQFLALLNTVIYDNLKRMDSYRNLTFMISHYQDNRLTFCGQHEEILLVRKDTHKIEQIDTIDLGFPLGLEENINAFLHTQQIDFSAGDTFILYTDGIPEAENSAGEFYGVERLAKQVLKHIEQPVEVMHELIIADLHKHINNHKIFDDITLLIIRHN